jgi:PilZ domain
MTDHWLEHIEVCSPESRRSMRFPIRCKLQFKMSNGRSAIFVGTGVTLNMSRSGVLFESDRDSPVGGRIELSIDWPVQLDENCLLKLVEQGRVVRHENRRFAVKIERYEFKRQAASLLEKSAARSKFISRQEFQSLPKSMKLQHYSEAAPGAPSPRT